MTVKLNELAYKHAKRLIEEGKFIDDERDAWSDHHSSTQIEKELGVIHFTYESRHPRY